MSHADILIFCVIFLVFEFGAPLLNYIYISHFRICSFVALSVDYVVQNFPQEKLTSITSKGYRVGPCWKIRDRDGVGRSFSPGSCALSEVTSSDSTSTGEWKKPYLITVLLSFSSSFLKKIWEARRDLARFQTFRSRFAWMNSCMGFGWVIEFRGEGETKGDS